MSRANASLESGIAREFRTRASDFRYLMKELIDGESLADRLKKVRALTL